MLTAAAHIVVEVGAASLEQLPRVEDTAVDHRGSKRGDAPL